MRDRVLKALADNPNGLRARDFGAVLNIYHVMLIEVISELVNDGSIIQILRLDTATMDSHYIYKLVK
jgi:hypothetical protein